jgi:hypothetical protein
VQKDSKKTILDKMEEPIGITDQVSQEILQAADKTRPKKANEPDKKP